MAEATLWVEVVSAGGPVWEGEAISVLARTTEGDIGIMPSHEPVLSVLVPCAAEILGTDNVREIVAVDGGFLSVNDNRVSILSQYAQLAKAISVKDAERELAEAALAMESGDVDEDVQHHFNRASAQVKAALKAAGGQR